MSIPTTEPAGFRAGDTVRWTRTAINSEGDRLDPADSWVLTYELRNVDGKITLTATDNGDGAHLVSLTAATTGAYSPGLYAWESYATLAADRWQIDAGTINIEPNYAALDVVEARSYAVRTLEKIEAVLEGKADHDVASYTLGGVSLARIPPAELEQWRSRLREEKGRDTSAEALAKGRGHRGILRVRV